MKRSLRVTLPGHEIGVLPQHDDGRVSWDPASAWEHAGQHPRLGVSFLRQPGPRHFPHGLLPWFENLLPEEGGELRRRLCALYSLHEGRSFGLLSALGRDLAGAVEAFGDGDEPEASPPSLSTNERESSGPAFSGQFSSLAGMQLKFTMSMLNERLSLPARSGDEQWIVKLPGERFPDLPQVESMTMSWARAAGLNVPEHRVVEVEHLVGLPPSWLGGVPLAFAVRRFDRRRDGTKIHQEDLCQALDLPPRDRYGDTYPRVSFDGVLRFIVDVCGEPHGRDFARRLGFMIASGNNDAHLKNWSLVWGEASVPALSPCYDLVATVAFEQFGWSGRKGPKLALPMGGCHDFDRIDEAVLQTFRERSALVWAAEEVHQGAVLAREAWGQVRHEAPQVMQAAIQTHWQRVPLLKHVALHSARS